MSSAPDPVIYWVRNDLRFHDNEALTHVASLKPRGISCLPVYVFDPRLLGSAGVGGRGRVPPGGLARCGPIRFAFLYAAIAEFAGRLAAAGSGLHVVVGPAEECLARCAKAIGAKLVVCSREFASDEVSIERAVAAKGLELAVFEAQLSVRLEEVEAKLPGGSVKGLPLSFSKYYRGTAQKLRPVAPLPPPAQGSLPPLPSQRADHDSDVTTDELPSKKDIAKALGQPHLAEATPWDARSALPRDCPPGESGGLGRVEKFLQTGLARYDRTRNGLCGEAFSSKASAWLANGSLSSRQLLRRAGSLVGKAQRAVEQLQMELAWRDYFKLLALKTGADFFAWKGLRGQETTPPTGGAEEFEMWCQGRTGNAFVDANMVELNLTGYMSNRGRQNVASYLVFDLGVDWRLGAAYFDMQLVDADPALNHGNWKYVAGTGTDVRDTKFDVAQQAQRYDPKGQHQKLWLRC